MEEAMPVLQYCRVHGVGGGHSIKADIALLV